MQILAYINLAVGLHPVFFLGVGHYELCNQKGYQEHSPLSLCICVCACAGGGGGSTSSPQDDTPPADLSDYYLHFKINSYFFSFCFSFFLLSPHM